MRSKLSPTEMQQRALAYLPDELLSNIPENSSSYSLFQGFEASIPQGVNSRNRKHRRHGSRAQKLLELEDKADDPKAPAALKKLRNEKQGLDHRLEMIDVRKNMCSTEIREIDNKIANLNSMRKIVLDRLAGLEQEETEIEQDALSVDNQLEDMQEELEDLVALSGAKTPTTAEDGQASKDSPGMEASFMSESIYEKLPGSAEKKTKRPKPGRRKTNFILHEHLQAGSNIREFPAHHDIVTALDFDVPFGTMVSAALDDTVRVWDLNAGRCMGFLEGHLSSVRCLQVEDNLVATGSMDATVRLWDLDQADYAPPPKKKEGHIDRETQNEEDSSDDEALFADASDRPPTPPPSNMRDCHIFTLDAHVAEVTALHFHNKTLISGSADKTLRQWDLEKGRCVQTLDVLWAAAQASASINPSSSTSPNAGANSEPTMWRQTGGRLPDANADFVGALQCFDAALACGTADGMVRLWDLRSGQVHRSLVGHTGPVTCLQFDDHHLVTGSMDRSIRIWDLRTGSIFDAFAYDNPITSMMFDTRRIVAAAGEPVVKVYNLDDGQQWSCGQGATPVEGEERSNRKYSIVEQVRVKDGFMVEGRRDGVVGVWST
ncbi:hypothetical protein FH972_009498 [Carpinus fangiana]|uniref:Mitochondrial division protein 1 n=1 Tax=Carpinus fangiana TaxID=176857 RepID=A0A660KNE8_9ROSI|nr:hypothetical protein FH972_009498 [Carpinus fangiana]